MKTKEQELRDTLHQLWIILLDYRSELIDGDIALGSIRTIIREYDESLADLAFKYHRP